MAKASLSLSRLTLEQVQLYLQSEEFKLRPTQGRLCFPILQRIHHKMQLGVLFDGLSTAGTLLLNGHHRYICSSLLNQSLEQHPWGSPSQMVVYNWPQVEIDSNDWETAQMIERHNAKDAARSGLDITLVRF